MNTKFSVEQSVNVRCPVIEDIQNVTVCNVELVEVIQRYNIEDSQISCYYLCTYLTCHQHHSL